MRNMKNTFNKNLIKIGSGVISALVFAFLAVTPAFADTSGSTPYSPHNPVPTSLGQYDLLFLICIVLIILGSLIITSNKALISKIS